MTFVYCRGIEARSTEKDSRFHIGNPFAQAFVGSNPTSCIKSCKTSTTLRVLSSLNYDLITVRAFLHALDLEKPSYI